jgi:hypothetical protein
MDACELFETAYACFQAAGESESAAQVDRTLTAWREHLIEQYTALRLRLKLALDENRSEDALKLVGELQGLLAHQRPGAYQQWLEQLGRQLSNKVTQG